MGMHAHDNAPIWRPLWGAISVPPPPDMGGWIWVCIPPDMGGVCVLCTPLLHPFCHHSAPCNCAQAAPDGLPISTRRVHPTRAQAPQRRPQRLTQPAPQSDPIRTPPAPLSQNARAQAPCKPQKPRRSHPKPLQEPPSRATLCPRQACPLRSLCSRRRRPPQMARPHTAAPALTICQTICSTPVLSISNARRFWC